MLELRGLSAGWGSTTIIENVNVVLAAGEAVSIIGRNGVGKTTLLETIVGRATRHHGTIYINGTDVSKSTVFQRARIGLGYVPQSREVFPSLSVCEHIKIALRPGNWNEDRIFQLFPTLARRRDSLGGQLSGGEQQMLAIARALATNPGVVLMDEPSEGLAPIVIEQLVDALKAVAAEGSFSLLLVEQRIDIAAELSSRCYIIDRGQIVRECDSAVLKRDIDSVSSLLGLE